MFDYIKSSRNSESIEKQLSKVNEITHLVSHDDSVLQNCVENLLDGLNTERSTKPEYLSPENFLRSYLASHEVMQALEANELLHLRLELEIVFAIARQYTALKEYRLSSFYLGYAYQLINKLNLFSEDLTKELNRIDFELQLQQVLYVYQTFFSSNEPLANRQLNGWCSFRQATDPYFSASYQILQSSLFQLTAFNAKVLEKFIEKASHSSYGAKIKDNIPVLQLSRLQEHRNKLEKARGAAITSLEHSSIETVQATWSAAIKECIKALCEEVKQELGESYGYRFCLLSLGSLSRDEACLRSDIEFALLCEEIEGHAIDVQARDNIQKYFQAFVGLLELKVIALGETSQLFFAERNTAIRNNISLGAIKQKATRGLQFDEAGNYAFSTEKTLFGFLSPLPLSTAVSSEFRLRQENEVIIDNHLYLYLEEYKENDKTKIRLKYNTKKPNGIIIRNQELTKKDISQSVWSRIIRAIKTNQLQSLSQADKNNVLIETRKRDHTPQRDDLLRLIQVSAEVGQNIKKNLSGDKSELFSRLRLHESHPYLLSEAEHLFSDKALAETFINRRNDVLQETYIENYWKFHHFLGFALGLPGSIEFPKITSGKQILIKHHLQFIQWVVKSLTLYYDIKEPNTIKRIQGLVDKHILPYYLSELFVHVIRFLFAARLRAHAHYGSERDELYLSEQVKANLFSLKQFPAGVYFEKELPTIYEYFNNLLNNWQSHVKEHPALGADDHAHDNEIFEHYFIKYLQTNAHEIKKIITDWVECLIMLRLEAQHIFAWYAFLFQQAHEQRLTWCELFYRASLRFPELADICLDILELSDSHGFRLLEFLHEQDLNDAISTLAAHDVSKPMSRKVTLYRANQPAMQLHPDVVKRLLDDKSHIIHNTGEKAKEAYTYRRVHRLQYQDTDIFFKEHPDFPIMAYGSYLLNMRLTGHGAALTELALVEVVQQHPQRNDFKVLFNIRNRKGYKLIYRMQHGIYIKESLESTNGAGFMVIPITDGDLRYRMEIWDFSFQDERNHRLVRIYARGASAIFIVFDEGKRGSFENAIKIIENVKKDVAYLQIILIKYKSNSKKEISEDEIQTMITWYEISYITCSAKTGEGIEELKQNLLDVAKKEAKNREQLNIQKLTYPVLISLAVAGKTIAEILKTNEYPLHPLSTKYLSDSFLTEQIKHHGDALAQNFVVVPLKNRGHQLMCVDLEQMFVASAIKEGQLFKTTKIQEVNILTCLPELQSGGLLFEQGLHPETLVRFANLDIDKILNSWLDTLEHREQGYLQLVNDKIAQELNQQRGDKHPHLHRMIFPRGVLRKLVYDLWVIKLLAQDALAKRNRLFPQTIVEFVSGKKVATAYFAPALAKLSPQKRLEQVCGRTVSQSNSEYLKFYMEERKSMAELAGSDYSIRQAKHELKGFYLDERNERAGEVGALMTLQHFHITVMNLTGLSDKEQKEILQRYHHTERKIQKFYQLHLEGIVELSDAKFQLLLSSSMKSLKSLTLKTTQGLSDKTILNLTKNFSLLNELVLHSVNLSTFRNGTSPITFNALRALYISYCEQLTSIALRAPKLEQAEIKSNKKLRTVDITAPKLVFIAIEENQTIQYLTIKPKLPEMISLIGVPKTCTFEPEKGLFAKAAMAYAESCDVRQEYIVARKIKTTLWILDSEHQQKNIVIHDEIEYLLFSFVLHGTDSATGSTSLLARFVNDTFDSNQPPTAGVDLSHKIIIVNNERITLRIYDLQANERNDAVAGSWYRGCQGGMIIFDLSSNQSFNRVIGRYNYVNRYKDNQNFIVIIVGNKSDLTDKREVSYEEGLALATRLGCHYIETSAKTGDNVNEAFQFLAESIYQKVLFNDEALPLPDYIKRPISQAKLITQFSPVFTAPKPKLEEKKIPGKSVENSSDTDSNHEKNKTIT